MRLNEDFSLKLQQMNELLGADFAIISSIDGSDYEVIAIESEFNAVKQGDHFKTQDTYCDKVLETDNTVIYTQVGAMTSMVLHPIYTAMQLESYIGEPIHKDGEVKGTLNFSAFLPKKNKFSEDEIEKVKSLAHEIEAAIL